MTQAELIVAVEALVDASTVCDTVLALARMCNEKAEHIRENWQDQQTAKVWDRVAKQLDAVAAKIEL